jgi:nicotinamidase-related amidase
MPGGKLPVKEADKIVPVINKYIKKFQELNRLIIATRDWHPENHISFKERGGPWPRHCIQNTHGAEFHPSLKLPDDVIIIDKATHPDRDAYSGFQETFLDLELRRHNIKRVFVSGVATEYCVRATVIDALKLGYETILLIDAIKGVELRPGDVDTALKEMLRNGAILAEYDDIFWE